MCAPNAPARPKTAAAYVGGEPVNSGAPITPGTATTPPFTSPSAVKPGASTTLPFNTNTNFPGSNPGNGIPANTKPAPVSGPVTTFNPWGGSTPGSPTYMGAAGATAGTSPAGFTPGATSSAPAGYTAPSSGGPQWINDWAAEMGRQNPSLVGQRISAFDPQYRSQFLDPSTGAWKGPLPDEWRNTLAGQSGFSGFKNNMFYGNGRDLLGGISMGGLDPNNITDENMKLLNSQGFAVTVPGAGYVSPTSSTPTVAPTAAPAASPTTGTTAPATGTASSDPTGPTGPANPNPWGNPATTNVPPVPVDTNGTLPPTTPSAPIPTTTVTPPLMDGGTQSNGIYTGGGYQLPTSTPDTLTQTAGAAPVVPKSYMPTGSDPRSSVAMALARKFNPQLWV